MLKAITNVSWLEPLANTRVKAGIKQRHYAHFMRIKAPEHFISMSKQVNTNAFRAVLVETLLTSTSISTDQICRKRCKACGGRTHEQSGNVPVYNERRPSGRTR